MDDYSQMTDEQLRSLKLRKPVPDITTREVDIELQRRMQEKNIEHTATLVKELQDLKDITVINSETSERNAKSANMLAKAALIVALVSTIFSALQVKVDVRIPSHCSKSGGGDEGVALWELCENYVRLGAYEFSWIGEPRALK